MDSNDTDYFLSADVRRKLHTLCKLPSDVILALDEVVALEVAFIKRARLEPSPKEARTKIAKLKKLSTGLELELKHLPRSLKYKLSLLNLPRIIEDLSKLAVALDKAHLPYGTAGNKKLDQDRLVVGIARTLIRHGITPTRYGHDFVTTVEIIFQDFGDDATSARRAIDNCWCIIEEAIQYPEEDPIN